jgi:hypothetical protein
MFVRLLAVAALAGSVSTAVAKGGGETAQPAFSARGLEYGYSHSGNKSWGSNWQAHARNKAVSKIQEKIADMANLEELQRSLSTELEQGAKGDGEYSYPNKGKGSFDVHKGEKISTSELKKYRNNFVVLVTNVRIKKGTPYSDTDKDWRGRRSYECSLTVTYDVEVYSTK